MFDGERSDGEVLRLFLDLSWFIFRAAATILLPLPSGAPADSLPLNSQPPLQKLGVLSLESPSPKDDCFDVERNNLSILDQCPIDFLLLSSSLYSLLYRVEESAGGITRGAAVHFDLEDIVHFFEQQGTTGGAAVRLDLGDLDVVEGADLLRAAVLFDLEEDLEGVVEGAEHLGKDFGSIRTWK